MDFCNVEAAQAGQLSGEYSWVSSARLPPYQGLPFMGLLARGNWGRREHHLELLDPEQILETRRTGTNLSLKQILFEQDTVLIAGEKRIG